MRSFSQNGFLVGFVLAVAAVLPVCGQFKLPGVGSKPSGDSNGVLDQFVGSLLPQDLPLSLNANDAYPTVPNSDLLGGPFRGRSLAMTLSTLTQPLPPGDYVLPMTFFCSEYSVHRSGGGIAYTIAPAKGSASQAISTLLWRGMLLGKSPHDLQAVSWSIQGSVRYADMPARYRQIVDQVIPDMKGQLEGQGMGKLQSAFDKKVNGGTGKLSNILNKGTEAISGDHVHVKVQANLQLVAIFERLAHLPAPLGQLGRLALDGVGIANTVTDKNLSDEKRDQVLFAGQGQQLPPMPAANGPWSVKVPGVAYMRFVVHSGNLQGDNVMQIRILSARRHASLDSFRPTGKPRLVLAQYTGAQASPSLLNLFNGSVDQSALSQCHASDPDARMCVVKSMSVSGNTAYPNGDSQVPDIAPAQPLPPSPSEHSLKILMGNTDITGTSQSVVVGQPIELTASNGNSSIEGQTTQWSVSGTTIGSYKYSGPSGTAPTPDLNSSTIHYFWIDQGQNLSVSVLYTSNGRTDSASATFTVSGPQGISISSEHGSFGVFPNFNNHPNGWWAIWGQPPPPGTGKEYPPGTLLKYEATSAPSGTYQWFQFILRDADSYTNAVQLCVADGAIPYGGLLNTSLKDSPGQAVRALDLREPFLQERARDFTVRSFLMWQPNIAGSIPVALGSLTWGYISHAKYTGKSLVARGGWEVTFTPKKEETDLSTALPQWSTTVPSKRGVIKAGQQQICP